MSLEEAEQRVIETRMMNNVIRLTEAEKQAWHIHHVSL